MNAPLRICFSANATALAILPTVIASVVRHAGGRPVEVLVYTRANAWCDFQSGPLTVTFATPRLQVATRNLPLPPEMFDRFFVIEDRPDWDRCLLFDWDQLAVGELSSYYDRPMSPDRIGAMVLGKPESSFGRNLAAYHHPALTIWPRRFFRFPGLLHLDACRAHGILETMLSLAWTLSSEMCLFAEAGYDRLDWVDPIWNALIGIDRVTPASRILHWYGAHKPWGPAAHADLWRAVRRSWSDLRAGSF